MRINIYELLSATTPATQDSLGLGQEGWAMLQAVAQDLSLVPGVEVRSLVHPSRMRSGLAGELVGVEDEFDEVLASAPEADTWLVIAPEIGRQLTRMCRLLEARGQSYMGPSAAVVDLCSDKLLSRLHLGEPILMATLDPSELVKTSRIVAKPRLGCGSMFTSAARPVDVDKIVEAIRARGCTDEIIFQPFIEGISASVLAIGDETGSVRLLPAGKQRMGSTHEEGISWFHYAGGEMPLPEALDRRARRLVERVVEAFSPIRGPIGFDLILGQSDDGRDDVIVDINPRLTTAYLGYSHLVRSATKDRSMMGKILLDSSLLTDQLLDTLRAQPMVSFTPSGSIRQGTSTQA